MQFPSQLVWQEPVQLASAVTLQLPLHDTWSCAEHDATTLIGVHFAVHPPEVSSSHEAVLSRAMSPHEERSVARACDVKNVNAAAESKETTMEEKRMAR